MSGSYGPSVVPLQLHSYREGKFGLDGVSPYHVLLSHRMPPFIISHHMSEEPFWEPGRKKPARGVHIRLGGPNVVWATLCTANRGTWLANDFVHQRLQGVWLAATKWLVSDYTIMPDHVHFFAAPYDIEYPFDDWVTYWERQFRKLHTQEEWRGELFGEVAISAGEPGAQGIGETPGRVAVSGAHP